MKENVFKKIAIGVAVSLATTGIIAGYTALFNSRDKGIACEHAARTVEGVDAAPTCTTAGTSGVVKCLDCGKVLVENEEVPAKGHNGDLGSICSDCGQYIYGSTQNANFLTFENVVAGEKVAGNWYRFTVCDGEPFSYWFSLYFGDISVDFSCVSGSLVIGDYERIDPGRYFPVVREIDDYFSYGYVDIYMMPGVTFNFGNPGQEYADVVLDDSVYIENESSFVQRIVLGE